MITPAIIIIIIIIIIEFFFDSFDWLQTIERERERERRRHARGTDQNGERDDLLKRLTVVYESATTSSRFCSKSFSKESEVLPERCFGWMMLF